MVWHISKIILFFKQAKNNPFFPVLTFVTGWWVSKIVANWTDNPAFGAIGIAITIYLTLVISLPLMNCVRNKPKVRRYCITYFVPLIITILIIVPFWDRLIVPFPTTDPYKQPLRTGTATVVVGLEPNSVSLVQYPSGYIQFMKGQEVLLGMKVSPANIYTKIVNNQTFCNATFELDQTCKSVGNPICHLTKTEFAEISLNIIPAKSRITDGYAIFTFNSSVRIVIPIPSQIMDGNTIMIQDIQKYFKKGI